MAPYVRDRFLAVINCPLGSDDSDSLSINARSHVSKKVTNPELCHLTVNGANGTISA